MPPYKGQQGQHIFFSHYTVTYVSGRKNAGTYKIAVKMKGNYSGTKTLTFKVLPAKTGISKVTGAKKVLTVKRVKKTTQVVGYEIRYSTSKSFKTYKSKTVASDHLGTIKRQKAKTTYYVRIRTCKTVNGKKVYAGWSTIKTNKTK